MANEPAASADPKRSPAVIAALVALVGSLTGNVVQYINGASVSKNAEQQLALAQEKWQSEREKMQEELNVLRAREATRRESEGRYGEELRQVNQAIATYDRSIFQDKAAILLGEGTGDTALVETHKNSLRVKEAEREKLAKRREEIERLLSGCK